MGVVSARSGGVPSPISDSCPKSVIGDNRFCINELREISITRRFCSGGETTPGDAPLPMADFPGFRKTGDRFGSRSGFRLLRQGGNPSHRIKEANALSVRGVSGRRYALPRSLTEPALARKFKHPKGLRCHYTFGTEAPFPRHGSLQAKRCWVTLA